MIGRQVIETKSSFTLQELEQFMRRNWNTEEYNDFFIGRPTAASIEEYILLPATRRFMVIAYSRSGGIFSKKNKVILSVCDTFAGVGDRLKSSIPSRNLFYNIWSISENMSIEKERKGPAEEVLQKYAAYMHELLSAEGLIK